MSSTGLEQRVSRDDYRKKKELQELRQSGAAPAELDSDGKMINPHIPQYVSDAPWYVNTGKVGLQHQYRKSYQEAEEKEDFTRGAKRKRAVVAHDRRRWVPGSCENCGSTAHKKRDCLERPRKRGAKITNDIAKVDEHLIAGNGETFSTKRDKWKDYDTSNYTQVVQRFQKIEDARNQKRAEEARERLRAKQARRQAKREARREKGEASQSDSSSSDDDFDDDVDEDMKDTGDVIQKRGAKSIVRNLRIREDTAKYMLNLDVNSAHYDPKSRSMREAPNPDNKSQFQGDNFARASSEAMCQTEVERFVWDAQRKGHTHIMDAVAAPSQAAILAKRYKENLANLQKAKKDSLKSAYGEQQRVNPDLVIAAASEQYVEYNEQGEAIKTQAKLIHKSKYDEDVLEAGHSEVYGSYWYKGEWGYKCCGQTTRFRPCLHQKN